MPPARHPAPAPTSLPSDLPPEHAAILASSQGEELIAAGEQFVEQMHAMLHEEESKMATPRRKPSQGASPVLKPAPAPVPAATPIGPSTSPLSPDPVDHLAGDVRGLQLDVDSLTQGQVLTHLSQPDGSAAYTQSAQKDRTLVRYSDRRAPPVDGGLMEGGGSSAPADAQQPQGSRWVLSPDAVNALLGVMPAQQREAVLTNSSPVTRKLQSRVGQADEAKPMNPSYRAPL